MVSQASGQPSTVSQWGANFGREAIRFPHRVHMILAQLLKRWPPPPSHSHTLCTSLDTLAIPPLQRSEKLKLVGQEIIIIIYYFFYSSSANRHHSYSRRDFILLGPSFVPLRRPPPLHLLAGGRDCWLAMFLVLVVTPELREFLARARCGAVRLLKVCIRDGEWAGGGGRDVCGWAEMGNEVMESFHITEFKKTPKKANDLVSIR